MELNLFFQPCLEKETTFIEFLSRRLTHPHKDPYCLWSKCVQPTTSSFFRCFSAGESFFSLLKSRTEK